MVNRFFKPWIAALSLIGLLNSPSAWCLGELNFGFGSLAIGAQTTAIELIGGYHQQMFFDWLQLGASLSYNTQANQDVGVKTMTAFIGPTFNIGPDFANAVFIDFGVVYRSVSSTPTVETSSDADAQDPNGTGLGLFVGKRIPVMNSLHFRPQFGLATTGGTQIILVPFQASLVF